MHSKDMRRTVVLSGIERCVVTIDADGRDGIFSLAI